MRAVYWVLPTEIDYGLGWVAVIIWVLNYKKQDKLHCSPGPLWSRRHNTASFLSACPTSPNKYNESDSLTNPALRLILRIVFYKSTTRKARAESQQIATCSFNPHRTKHCSFRTVVSCCIRGRAPSPACMCTYHLKQLRTYTLQFPSHWSVNLINGNH